MKTSVDEFHFGHQIGVADVLRLLLGMPSDKVTTAVNAIVTRWPGAYEYVPVGSRRGEARPEPAHIEYREGEVYYHRPLNYGSADCVWRVPRDHLR
jgi:hypothetical protein